MLASTYLSPPFLPFHHHTATTTTTTTSAHLLSGDPNRRARRHMSGTTTAHGISLRKQDILPPDTCDIQHYKKVFVSRLLILD
jgi:hypothetical protein